MADLKLPIRVAAVNDYEIIVAGVAGMLSRYPDRIHVCDRIVIGDPIEGGLIDVAMYDTYGRIGIASPALRMLADEPEVHRIAVFSLDLRQAMIDDARAAGADGFISKCLSGEEIADALVSIAEGRNILATAAEGTALEHLDWPGKEQGLSEGESQVLVLIGEGLNNAEIATALYLSVETVKSRIKRVFSKLEVRNRIQAATWVARSGAFVRYQPADPTDAKRKPPG